MKTDGRLGKTDAVSSSAHTFDPKNKLIAVTGAAGAAKAVFLGPDDVEKGMARLKNMITREETDLCLE